ncbi:hypothetical protein Ahy_A03g015257 [Arachis hypogaea]|uniref:RNase H type-1 domain-containing protein n=1 Tax=Arachis hypogaea TaxID=3818 RepID=A0A445E0D1_ARAHY|nr:hypothetical protein Ahy_A03g015257 [Arachis hypogaea]
MCKKHKPAIIYLMETRCKEKNVKKYARKLQFRNSFCVEPRGLSGGLCLLWNEKVSISVYSWCQNYIIADIKSNNNPNWKCCFTYGNPIFKQRRRTWQAIIESKDMMDEPSCFIVNWKWRQIFNHAKLIALPVISSDHCPLLLNIEPNQKVPRQFRYEAYWDDKEECKEVIRKGWTSKAQGENGTNLWKEPATASKISKSGIGGASKEPMRRLLDGKQQQEIENAKQRIRELWGQEEKYWAQRARVKWLKWGDRNTAFFHASTIQRRDRNRIDRLRDAKGRWVWGDNWIHGFNEPLNRGSIDNQRVEELLTSSRDWDRAKIQRSFPPVVAEKIVQTPVSRISKEDRLLWPFRKDGEFTTKTGYYVAKKGENERNHNNRPSSSAVFEELWGGIWNMKAPQKIKMFLWKAAHNIILVRANLKKKRLLTNSVCPICLQEEETEEHTLLLCEWTRAVWFGSQSQCTPTSKNVRSVGEWLQRMYMKCKEASRPEADQNWSRIGITIWTIWKARNNQVYNNIEPNLESTINHARIIEKEYNSLIKENNSKVRENNKGRPKPVIWRPPPYSWLKINSDALFSSGTKSGATASVIKDHTEKILGGSASVIQANSSLSAEAQAVREAVILAENLNIQNVIIETDSLQLVQTLKTRITIWDIDPIIQDIIDIQKRLPNCGFTWTPREGNRLAHSIAALKLKN